jgi:ribonuclease P protein component
MGKFTFKKEERLNKEKWIKELFEKGSSFHLYPFRVIYLPHPDPLYPVNQVLISVSVRNFRKAVDRNLLKRRIREAYRLTKPGISSGGKWLIAYIYTGKKTEPSSVIRGKLPMTFDKMFKKENEK